MITHTQPLQIDLQLRRKKTKKLKIKKQRCHTMITHTQPLQVDLKLRKKQKNLKTKMLHDDGIYVSM